MNSISNDLSNVIIHKDEITSKISNSSFNYQLNKRKKEVLISHVPLKV